MLTHRGEALRQQYITIARYNKNKMTTKPLYKYKRGDGGVTVSPIKPDAEYTEMVRLIADEGKALTKDGKDLRSVVDADSADGWYEVDAPKEDIDEVSDTEE